jgi:hypothetical protein
MNSCHAIVHANVFLLVVATDVTADTPTTDAGGPPWTETVAHLNIEHYRKLLTQEMDETKRQTTFG